MKTMEIEWKRLVTESGQTCERCAGTGKATEAAFDKLRRCLAEVGIEVSMKKSAIEPSAFFSQPLESNRILIDGRSIEQWIDGSTGQSPCCGPCGDAECRTITVDGKTYETIPEHIILRAGLLAAAQKLKQ